MSVHNRAQGSLAVSLVNAGPPQFSDAQFPTTHWRAALPNFESTMARYLERSFYRLQRFQCSPFFRARPRGTIRFLPLHTLARTLNQPAAPFLLGNVRGLELLL